MNASAGIDVASEAMDRLRSMFYLVPWWEMKTNYDKGVIRNYSGEAVPTFIGLVILEFLVGTFVCGLKVYRARDTYSSFLQGMTQQLMMIYQRGFVLALYIFLWDRFRLVDLTPCTWYEWLLALLSADLAYYWMHRHAHEYHFFWTAHSVHHSGEDFNLATALRQGILQAWFSWMWFMPMTLFIPPTSFAVHRQLNTLYQFWIHTTLVGWLGPLEYVLNTPSHHRMHHRPPGNRNYAGVLIIWDRMFGTFECEEEQIDFYGLAKQVKAFDPVSLNLEHASRVLANVNPEKKRDLWFYFKLLTKRRVKHKSVFSPLALFEPLPRAKTNLWRVPQKSKRVKYNGDDAVERSFLYELYLAVKAVSVLALYVFSAEKFLNKEGVSQGTEYFVTILVLANLVSVGRLAQSLAKGWVLQSLICAGLCALAYAGDKATFVPQEIQKNAMILAQVETGVWVSVLATEVLRSKVMNTGKGSKLKPQ